MTRSRYATQAFAEGTFAPGYDGAAKLGQEFMNAYASGGLYTTPSEMGQLGRMLLGGGQLDGKRILQPSSVQEMARNQTLGQPIRPVIMPDAYGLGWDGIRQDGLAAVGVTAWHKGGATASYTAEFLVLPDEGLALMVMGASLTYGSGALAERILLNALLERGRIAALPAPWQAGPLPVVAASAEQLDAVAGVYAAYDRLLRIKVHDDGTLELSRYAENDWVASPDLLKWRSDGTFSSDAAPTVSYRAVTSAGEQYLVLQVPYGYQHYRFEFAYVQKITPRPALLAAWQDRMKAPWLAVNEAAGSPAPPLLTLKAAPDSPGYLLASAGPLDKSDCILDASTSDRRASMCLKIPYLMGRDLDDVLVETHAGEEWLRMGSSLFRPASGVPALGAGVHSVRIGSEGFAQWRSLPASGQVSIGDATAWRLYDADFAPTHSGAGNGSAALAGRGNPVYLMLFGTAGADLTVTVS